MLVCLHLHQLISFMQNDKDIDKIYDYLNNENLYCYPRLSAPKPTEHALNICALELKHYSGILAFNILASK